MPPVAATWTLPSSYRAAAASVITPVNGAGQPPATGTASLQDPQTLQVPSGIPELDEYLGGGLPAGACVMLAGAPFLGKKLVARQFLAAAVAQNAPYVAMLTDSAAFEWRRQLHRLAPGAGALEAAGAARYVDMVSHTLDPDASEPCTDYLDGALTSEAATHALGSALAGIGGGAGKRFVFDSLSTLAAFTSPSVALLTLLHTVGRLKRVGATSLILVDTGAHAETDLQVLKRQVDGVLEFRTTKGENEMRLVGLGLPRSSPWVTYAVGRDRIKVTGSWNLLRLT